MIFKGTQLEFRMKFVRGAFLISLGLLVGRSAYLQLIPNEKLSSLQKKQFDRTVTLKPRRGVIYDRNGDSLAFSIPSKSLFADPKKLKEPYYVAKKLSGILEIDKNKLLKKLLNKKRRFVWIKRHLSEKELKAVKVFDREGLHLLKESKRFYSQIPSLSPTLGLTGRDGQGLEGIEKVFDEQLKGEAQKVLIKRDAKGRPLFMDYSPFILKSAGYDIHLSIDSDLQIYMEQALSKAMKRSEAETAIGVVMGAKTSEVLALVNLPGYDLNQPPSIFSKRRNRAITDTFEQGSTFKVFTLMSALKKGIPASKTYSSQDGKLEIGNYTIKEASEEEEKKFKPFLNLTEILSFSSNVGAASMALDVGSKTLRNTLSELGFGKKTGINFPGETKGELRQLPWRPVETATVSYGHGVSASALQIVQAYTAIANGGLLKTPLLVKSIKNPHTGEEKTFYPQVKGRVLSKKQAKALSLMMISVTDPTGTGARASVPGYFVAGKTGTAKKIDPSGNGYKEGEYISSFIGFLPAHDPEFVIYVMVDGAKKNFYASSLVAPVFSQVASYSVRRAGLSPTLVAEENILKKEVKERKLASKSPSEESNGLMPSLKGLSLRQSLRKLDGKGLILTIKGSGKLKGSLPKAYEPLPKDKKVTLTFH